MTMTSLLWRHLYLERSQSVQYFAQQFSVATRSVEEHSELNTTSEQVQQANMFKRQTLMFHFSTYRPNSFRHLSYHTQERESTAAIVASVVETTWWPGYSSSTTLSRPRANFLHQTCIAGLVKYLSPYTGRISDWMALALSPFAHSKQITEGCSLWDDFNGNAAISYVYKWHHSDKTHSSYSELNPL